MSGTRKRQHLPSLQTGLPCPAYVISWNDKTPLTDRSQQDLHASLKYSNFVKYAMTTISDGLRQSDRVTLCMPVEASWVTGTGATFKQTAETLLERGAGARNPG